MHIVSCLWYTLLFTVCQYVYIKLGKQNSIFLSTKWIFSKMASRVKISGMLCHCIQCKLNFCKIMRQATK